MQKIARYYKALVAFAVPAVGAVVLYRPALEDEGKLVVALLVAAGSGLAVLAVRNRA